MSQSEPRCPECGSHNYGCGPNYDNLRWIGCFDCGYGFTRSRNPAQPSPSQPDPEQTFRVAAKALLRQWMVKHARAYQPGGWDYDKEGAELVQQTADLLGVKDPWCPDCGGTGGVDSGGFSPWGSPISLPCPSCGPKQATLPPESKP